MTSATIVEILLALLTIAVGFISYSGSNRAAKAQALATEADVDAEAYDRAKGLYESVIDTLESQVARLNSQTTLLDQQLGQLQRSNTELRKQVFELQIANTRLEAEVRSLREGRQ